ncbi:hypothetical protein H9P43_005548 [Blastocladiella emersonii ATCC 22665]|nr:hypothetical protein H9P43_005548 [Blastocladiella emersonii ATCC 22665]
MMLAATDLPSSMDRLSVSAASAQATPAPGPAIKQAAVTVDGRATKLVVMGFANRTVVLITQLGKVGALLHAEAATPWDPLAAPGDEPTVLEKRLLGAESTLHSVYATQVCHAVARVGLPGPVVLGLALAPLPRTAPREEDEDAWDGSDDLEAESARMRAIMGRLEDLIRPPTRR